MSDEIARIFSHVSNGGIVQMPGRRFPGIVLQGDSLSALFDAVAFCLNGAKARRDQETYFALLTLAESLQGHLLHYEETLARLGTPLPYMRSIRERLVRDVFDA